MHLPKAEEPGMEEPEMVEPADDTDTPPPISAPASARRVMRGGDERG